MGQSDKRYAVIELGTRGIRLLVADASPSGVSRVYSTGGLSELGSSRDAQGNISRAAIERSRAQVEEYCRIAREKSANNNIVVFATEAVRSAPNQEEFAKELNSIAKFLVLDPQTEALCSLMASVDAFRGDLHPGDTILVLDQGGGSTEIACGTIDRAGELRPLGMQSLRLGTVDLAKQLVESDSLIAGFRRVEESIHRELKKHEPFPVLRAYAPTLVCGLGSAIAEVAKIRAGSKDYHGQSISKEELGQCINNFRTQYRGSSAQDSDLSDNTITMIAGVQTYYQILEEYHASQIRASDHGLRYGVLLLAARHLNPKHSASSSQKSAQKPAPGVKQNESKETLK